MSPNPSLDDLRIERGAASGSKARTWPIIVSVVVVVAIAVGVWLYTRPKAVGVRTVAAREVTNSAGSGAGAAERTVLNASGYVTARRQSTVSSKVTGKVVEVLIEEGLKVKQGQILARLDDT